MGIPQFYAPRPVKTGRPFNTQLDEIRENSEVTAVLARASEFDFDTARLQDSALQAIRLGQNSFKNRFRMIFDDSDTAYKIQRNTGTNASPTWTTDFTIDSSGNVTGAG